MPEAKEAMDFADAPDDNVIRAAIAAAPKSAKFPYGYSVKNGLLMFSGGDDDPIIVSAAIDVLAQTRDDLSADVAARR